MRVSKDVIVINHYININLSLCETYFPYEDFWKQDKWNLAKRMKKVDQL